jgi:hypothetical protein
MERYRASDWLRGLMDIRLTLREVLSSSGREEIGDRERVGRVES